MSRKLSALALAGISVYSVHANAFDFDPSVFTFNGFGTLGVIHSTEDRADYSSNSLIANGVGFSHTNTMDVDTRLAGQMTAKFNDKLTAIVQVVAQYRLDNTFSPEFEWANLKYSFTPDFNMRVGRIAMPSYLFSDTRKVGYALPWVRPSPEVYRLLPITNSDGVDATYSFMVGRVKNSVQAIYGENTVKVPGGFNAEATGIWGVLDTVAIGDLTIHAAYQGQQLRVAPVFQQKQPMKLKTLGASYDPGKWFVIAEWSRVDAFYGNTAAWYASAGVRIDKFTPYFSVAQLEPKSASAFGGSIEQDSLKAGVRWDFMSNFDLKLEVEHVELGDNAAGILTNL
jgi:hypothetical protein